MIVEQDIALDALFQGVHDGTLAIITNEVKPELRRDQADPRSPAHDGVDLRDPSVFVVARVTRIEGPDSRGRVRAYSDAGDYVEGYPVDVLARVSEARLE